MLKSIKIPEEAYKDAKKLSDILEEENIIKGVYNIKLTTAISYAIKRTLEDLKNRNRFLSAAGGWKDIDKNLIKKIYKGRKSGTQWGINLD